MSISEIDSITGGGSFSKFRKDVEILLKENPDKKYVLFYGDIRNFKYINDVYGFETGNKVLQMISDGLAKGGKLAYARMNADNFVSLEEYKDEDVIVDREKKLLEKLSDVSGIIAGMSKIAFYVGAYCVDSTNRSMSVDAMLDRANMAQKRLRQQGTESGCMIFDEGFRQKMLEEQRMENRMEEALYNQEYVIYLQPKYHIRKNKIVAAEALVRWEEPQEGLIPPGKFIPLFEKNGFVKRLDPYMFEKTCRLLRKWLDLGKEPVSISVNVSRVLLSDNRFLDHYIAVKKKYGIPDGMLEIEFTESMLFNNIKRMEEVLSVLRKHGFSSSIDDFGAGYSSLNVLKSLPVDFLKLDKVFFDESSYKDRERVIIQHVISMAKGLAMETVAEGVEKLEQVEFLKTVDCEMIQGYVYDRPLPVMEFEKKYIH